MTQRSLIIPCLLPALLLAGCGTLSCGAPHPYLDSPPTRPPLQVPPGMTAPTPDPTFQIPAAVSADKSSPDPCMITPPKVIQQDTGAAPTAAPAAGTAKPAVPAPAVRTSSPPPVAARGAME